MTMSRSRVMKADGIDQNQINKIMMHDDGGSPGKTFPGSETSFFGGNFTQVNSKMLSRASRK